MKSISDIVEASRGYEAAGQIWRAKELLRGNIAGGRVDPPLLEEYGRLLDSVGDRVEAGKYLFLSGVRSPAYDAAIEP